MAIMGNGLAVVYVDSTEVGVTSDTGRFITTEDLLRPVVIYPEVSIEMNANWGVIEEVFGPVLRTRDETRGASVDDLIDDIDAVLDAYRES